MTENDAIRAYSSRYTPAKHRQERFGEFARHWSGGTTTLRIATWRFPKLGLKGSNLCNGLKDFAVRGALPLGDRPPRSFPWRWKELRLWWTDLFSLESERLKFRTRYFSRFEPEFTDRRGCGRNPTPCLLRIYAQTVASSYRISQIHWLSQEKWLS